VVGVLASAGGIPALIELLQALPADFELPILIAQHLPRQASSLAAILSWRSALKVCWAENCAHPQSGRVYLAPPGTSMTLTALGLALTTLPPHSSAWLPSADRMLQSLAEHFGARAIAIVLSGMLPAGVNGVRAVRAIGGITMAQNAKATAFEMPSAAIDLGKAEIVAPPSRIAAALRVVSHEWAQS
jgi:chemotaxis response regulator CheB